MTDSDKILNRRFVDVGFSLRPGPRHAAKSATIPVDHGYALLGAVARALPVLHEKPYWALLPVLGQYLGQGVLALSRKSRLEIRLPAEEVGLILDLSGIALNIAGTLCRLGLPQLRPLQSPSSLRSRIVTIKGFEDQEPFMDALRRQITALPGLGQDPKRIEIELGSRRVLRIKGTRIAGFAVSLVGLESSTSLAIQKLGLGGRRHMGAGVFLTTRLA